MRVRKVIIPKVGSYYSVYSDDSDALILKCVKEDELWFFFEDGRKHLKEMPCHWFEREKPNNAIGNEEVFIFPYDTYSLWSRQLAQQYTVKELQKLAIEKGLFKPERITGDIAYLSSYYVTKPCYKWNGRRDVRVRYEEERKYTANMVKINYSIMEDCAYTLEKAIKENSPVPVYYNINISVKSHPAAAFFNTQEEAKTDALARARIYQEACDHAEMCR